jgi:hypothetical protein
MVSNGSWSAKVRCQQMLVAKAKAGSHNKGGHSKGGCSGGHIKGWWPHQRLVATAKAGGHSKGIGTETKNHVQSSKFLRAMTIYTTEPKHVLKLWLDLLESWRADAPEEVGGCWPKDPIKLEEHPVLQPHPERCNGGQLWLREAGDEFHRFSLRHSDRWRVAPSPDQISSAFSTQASSAFSTQASSEFSTQASSAFSTQASSAFSTQAS